MCNETTCSPGWRSLKVARMELLLLDTAEVVDDGEGG